MPSKYSLLTEYLNNCKDDEVSLSFEQVSDIINGLPQSAYVFPNTWYKGGILGNAILVAGYKAKLKINQQAVTFCKAESSNNGALQPKYRVVSMYSPTLEIEKSLNSIRKYHDYNMEGTHTRYRSWVHCYKAFKDNRQKMETTEFLCLHLAWYLASWGMLRNSFLLDHDYLVHKDVVNALLDDKYVPLFENAHSEDIIPLTIEAARTIENSYGVSHITDTLITKILLGVFGCVPAYDRYFKNAARKYSICSGLWGERSLKSLWQFYNYNRDYFESLRSELLIEGIQYPPMKLIDMCLWQLGFDEDKTKVTV
jgi:hypothetical protein